MTTKEVADRLVSLCRQGQIQQAGQELYGENIVSIEPPYAPVPMADGLKAVIEKGQAFANMIEATHGGSVSDPIVEGNYFSIGWSMDVTMKGVGRTSMQEVCIYKVENGKIVREEFFY
ncbi:MAG TPA: nuclear transport factor 2 family protein [Chitinophagaceae bacterium]|nr:nuclear transport factor 2 family protein [Chitinophagaceae bacterium]